MKRSIGSIGSEDEGNTNSSSSIVSTSKKTKRAPLSKKWCFTLNNYSKDQMDHLYQVFSSKEVQYIFGEEVGEAGTPHLQGYIECPKRVRASEMVGIPQIHWAVAKGTREQNVKYCSKDGKVHSNMDFVKDPLGHLSRHTQMETNLSQEIGDRDYFYPWQERVLDIIAEPTNDRTIHWIYDRSGNKGKTALAKHICLKNDRAIYVCGKAADVKFAIAKMIEAHKAPKVVLFGLPRTSEGYVSYSALEEIKDGIFFSGKYEGAMQMFNPPHIIVMANFPPDKSKLSEDRWDIAEIDDNKELIQPRNEASVEFFNI